LDLAARSSDVLLVALVFDSFDLNETLFKEGWVGGDELPLDRVNVPVPADFVVVFLSLFVCCCANALDLISRPAFRVNVGVFEAFEDCFFVVSASGKSESMTVKAVLVFAV
jgi:hypothetical protein